MIRQTNCRSMVVSHSTSLLTRQFLNRRVVPWVCVTLVALWCGATASAQCPDRLTASDQGTGDQFGSSVSISGLWAVVGAPFDDDVRTNAGAAYLYQWNGTGWVQDSKLTPLGATAPINFGSAVDIDLNRVVIGAPGGMNAAGVRTGLAYVYHRVGFVWTLQDVLEPSQGGSNDEFGASVSIRGDNLIVGGPRASIPPTILDAGSAYIFHWNGSSWTEQQQLFPDAAIDPLTSNDQFGVAVAIDGNNALVGMKGEDFLIGAVWAYWWNGSFWTRNKLPMAGISGSLFGLSVDLSGTAAIIGAQDSASMMNSGAAYVFRRTGSNTWTLEDRLTASNAAADDWFGFSVSISGDLAWIGAYKDDHSGFTDAGSAYVFGRSGTTWVELAQLTAAAPGDSYLYGKSVAIDGARAIAGSPAEPCANLALACGAAYIERVPPAAVGACCNESGSDVFVCIGTQPFTLMNNTCMSGVSEIDCTAPGMRFVAGVSCSVLSPLCGLGACCFTNGVCSSESPSFCAALGGSFQGIGTPCIPNPCPPPGACCDASGTCALTTSSACTSMGGTFFGIGSTCSPSPCAPPPPPANDDCSAAIPIAMLPTSVSADTTAATLDTAPICMGIAPGAPGVWYTVTGTGNTIKASTCNSMTSYNTQISVYCGGCSGLTCVGANDDDPACSAFSLVDSTVSWCSALGETYHILVHGFGGATGTFTLDIFDDLTPCSPPVSCSAPVVGACCNQSGASLVTSVGVIPDGSCMTDVPPADCAGLPGLTFDLGNDCTAGALMLSCAKLVESKWTQLPHGIPSDCCTAHPTAGCDVTSCEAAVCAMVPHCCDAAAGGVWDALCASLADSLCPGVCVGSAGPIGFNVASDVDWQALAAAPQGTPSVPDWVVADDFQSDGRPITCIRWWGSYIDPAFKPTLAAASRSASSSTARPSAATKLWHGRPVRVSTGETPVPQISSQGGKNPGVIRTGDARLPRVQTTDSTASKGSDAISRAIPPTGACCLPSGSCIIVSQSVCSSLGGVFSGPGSVCPPGPCTPGTNVDGWLISFHSDDPLGPGGFSQPLDLLGLYFCPADAVTIKPTGIFGDDGHEVFEYFVELSECHLIHSQFDPRPGATPPDPAQLDAFLETQGFIYWLDIQAVVGHTYVHAGQLFGSEPVGGGGSGMSQIWDITVPGGPDALIGPPTHPISALSGLARCPNSIIGVTGTFGGGTVHIFDLAGTLLFGRPTVPTISSMAGASTAPPGATAAGFIPGHVYATANTTGGGPTDSLYDLGPCGIGPDVLVGSLVDPGGLPIVGIDGLAFDATTCTLYGSTNSSTSSLPGDLVAISSAGLVTDIGPILVGGLPPAGSVSGLAFDGGILYGSLGSGVGDIIVIPPAAPDMASFDHSATAGAGSIAGLTNGQGPSWVEVPTKNRAFDHFWGWHTSPDEWNDASVTGELVMGPAGEWIYQTWLPVDGSLHMLPRVDQAFELLTPTTVTCPCLGDMDGNSVLDGLDIQGFVDCMLKVAAPPINCACADMNGDGTVDLIDVPLFTSTLLTMLPCP